MTRYKYPAASNLAELRDELVADGKRQDRWDHIFPPQTFDWTDLPVFGGVEPTDTAGVWSWDADSLLVGSCAGDLLILSRAEWEG